MIFEPMPLGWELCHPNGRADNNSMSMLKIWLGMRIRAPVRDHASGSVPLMFYSGKNHHAHDDFSASCIRVSNYTPPCAELISSSWL